MNDEMKKPVNDENEAQAQEPAAVEEVKPVEEPMPAEPVEEPQGVPIEEVNRRVAEAEARGYLRGRNEAVAERMNTPALWENPRRTEMEQECNPDPACGFLSKIRPSAWD